MNIVLFYHSLVSDWNHGNAHFLRGMAMELSARGHRVEVHEPEDGWSRRNLIEEHGDKPIRKFRTMYPGLKSSLYNLNCLDLEDVLDGAELVVVHEWTDPELVRRIGEHRARNGKYHLLFHDTHHRMHSDPDSMQQYDLTHYDGVLAYGRALQRLYEKHASVRRCWTWHEAADTRRFHPIEGAGKSGELVWIGNWGDGERAEEIREFLIEPVNALGLKARVYGVRYPQHALKMLADAGIEYGGWLPNYEAPEVFARYRFTVHVPRRPYVNALPGIPTIRVFEALACGIPLICSPWNDSENLFRPGRDYLTATDGRDMIRKMERLVADDAMARDLSASGLETIHQRHTCAHRADELLKIIEELK